MFALSCRHYFKYIPQETPARDSNNPIGMFVSHPNGTAIPNAPAHRTAIPFDAKPPPSTAPATPQMIINAASGSTQPLASQPPPPPQPLPSATPQSPLGLAGAAIHALASPTPLMQTIGGVQAAATAPPPPHIMHVQHSAMQPPQMVQQPTQVLQASFERKIVRTFFKQKKGP